jgi:hypothetical protein
MFLHAYTSKEEVFCPLNVVKVEESKAYKEEYF